jgi:hypothetical protein
MHPWISVPPRAPRTGVAPYAIAARRQTNELLLLIWCGLCQACCQHLDAYSHSHPLPSQEVLICLQLQLCAKHSGAHRVCVSTLAQL